MGGLMALRQFFERLRANRVDAPFSRHRRSALLSLAAAALLIPACESDGNFTLFGYTTRPNYDVGIHTIRVPIFKNNTFIQRVEFDLTQAVIREIELKTPFKVVSADCAADTELTGTVVSFTKGILDVNQLNEVREAETTLAVEVVWRDLRTGEYLTKPIRRPGQPAVTPLQAPRGLQLGLLGGPVAPTAPQEPVQAEPVTPGTDPNQPGGGPPLPSTAPPVAPELAKPPGVLVRSVESFIPELGESRTTALQKNVNNLAVQIVSMMEKPW
jgi:hypothetical protein